MKIRWSISEVRSHAPIYCYPNGKDKFACRCGRTDSGGDAIVCKLLHNLEWDVEPSERIVIHYDDDWVKDLNAVLEEMYTRAGVHLHMSGYLIVWIAVPLDALNLVGIPRLIRGFLPAEVPDQHGFYGWTNFDELLARCSGQLTA